MRYELQYRHDTYKGVETILLVEAGDDWEYDNAKVVSEWPVHVDTLRLFCQCCDDCNWDTKRGARFTSPREYGKLLAVKSEHTLIDVGPLSEWKAVFKRHFVLP